MEVVEATTATAMAKNHGLLAVVMPVVAVVIVAAVMAVDQEVVVEAIPAEQRATSYMAIVDHTAAAMDKMRCQQTGQQAQVKIMDLFPLLAAMDQLL